ncbi:bifunctional 2-C-methyl-D-erythritol 4-phosphate cytidylyltransferase/2-C-methyl-D-erythritol 2,4-cyclodiphosphate synthase [Roseibium sp.]|uniref:bifunctional 2-C-methyl-D-erythritol 4-phosphate cytidylyltransferase/2-C-methyl-D-erythritol 2,4-cyclodiphosphate synthase n=1 Tax=Roseibium sp. TaxID=1936156 RepID=UPI003A9863AF
MTKSVAAIIVAGGRGTRLSGETAALPKQYLELGRSTVLTRTVDRFLSNPGIAYVLVVRHRDDETLCSEALAKCATGHTATLLTPVSGGMTRQISVRNGLKALASLAPDLVLIHDAARPFVDDATINLVIHQLSEEGCVASLAAAPVFDTLKRVDDRGGLTTVDRTGLWAAQTPQGFDYRSITKAHLDAEAAGRDDFTDDTAIAEWAGLPVAIAESTPENFKITTQSDLIRARKRLRMTAPEQTPPSENDRPRLSALGDVRTGTGYDVHAFEAGDAVILGGVAIPHNRKLKGHSDADVVLHAITDAVLGAIADGDIGHHFPPSDPKWKGAASDQFLQYAIERVSGLGGRIAHIDATIICEAPKIGPHRDAIRESIAAICDVPVGRVSVKATTSERLGFTGRKEGIAAMAAVTIRLPFSDEE